MLSCWTFTYTSWDSFVEDPNQVVMDESMQDPLIKHTYENLPWVGLVLSQSPIACVAYLVFSFVRRTAKLVAFAEDPKIGSLVRFSEWKNKLRPYREE
jgi:hypothetical protein